MAASDEFPRGTTATSIPAGGTAAQVVLPASPGIAHVLDSFYCQVFNAGAAAAGAELTVSSPSLGSIPLAEPIAAAGAVASDSDTGLGIAAQVGEAVTIRFSTGINFDEVLRVGWHDI